MTGPHPEHDRWAARIARVLVRLRWFIIAFWTVATVASLTLLPPLESGGGDGGLKGILSTDTPAVLAEQRSVDIFGFPLIARTVLVQRDPDGLSPYASARTVVRALAVDRGEAGDVDPILGALPVTNTAGLFPGTREQDTAALTYLLFAPDTSLGQRRRAAQDYAERFFTERDAVVGVTGTAPARAVQGDIISDALPNVELATVIAIVLIVGIAFRSVVAPVVTVITAGVAYVSTLRVSGAATALFDLPSPDELEPVVVALLLGIVTDYVVFFCSAMREVRQDDRRAEAVATAAVTRSGPIVAVAGLAVATGTATLLAAESPFFRALGPALAFTVLVGLVVAITLVPAVMAVLGDLLLWPGGARRRRTTARWHWPESVIDPVMRSRRVAAIATGATVLVLLAAASPVLSMRLGVSFVSALPPDAPVRSVAASAQAAFSEGILSPTTVLLEGDGVGRQRPALRRLARGVSRIDGVAGVLGPGFQPVPAEAGILVSRGRDAARLLVVLDRDPLGAGAVAVVDDLRDALPSLLEESGIPDATVDLAGDSATASYLVRQTEGDLLRIAVAAMVANLVMLLVFLRAIVASILLLGASLLSLTATLGITTVFFEWLEPGQGLTFYVPFATAVLLLAFGSDYNIFTVGHVWEAARTAALRRAARRALPPAIGAVTAAGLALAASFGLLALVPLLPFRQLAFAITVGIMLDVVVVRTLLVPGLLSLLGDHASWPSRTLAASPPDDQRRLGSSASTTP